MKGKVLCFMAVLVILTTVGPAGPAAADSGERRFETRLLIADIVGGDLRDKVWYYTIPTSLGSPLFLLPKLKTHTCQLPS